MLINPRLITPAPADGRSAAGFADAVERGLSALTSPASAPAAQPAPETVEPPVITGASVGLPGTDKVFDDANVGRILSGQSFISSIPAEIRQHMVDRRITRLVKRESGDATFEAIDDPSGQASSPRTGSRSSRGCNRESSSSPLG